MDFNLSFCSCRKYPYSYRRFLEISRGKGRGLQVTISVGRRDLGLALFSRGWQTVCNKQSNTKYVK